MEKKHKEESGFQRFRRNMEGLTFEQKLDHIITYYWGTVLLMILIPVSLVILLCSAFREEPEFAFAGDFSNVILSEEGKNYLCQQWIARMDVDPESVSVTAEQTLTDGLESIQEADGGLQVVAAVAADSLDYIVCDETALRYYAAQQAYLPLDDVLQEHVLSQWSDRIYYYTEPEFGATFPVALDVTDLPFVQTCVKGEGRIYFCFANKNNPNLQRLQLFLTHLSAWDQ